MKKIIDGKMYNTETARELIKYTNRRSSNDFEYVEETLYQTKKGSFFIKYYGGANSLYGVWANNTGHSGSGLKVLTETEAKKWCEKVMDADQYIEIFGEVEEG